MNVCIKVDHIIQQISKDDDFKHLDMYLVIDE